MAFSRRISRFPLQLTVSVFGLFASCPPPSSQTAPRWSMALAQESATLENIVIDLDVTTYKIPKLVATGSSLGKTELAALFDPKTKETLAARLAALSAGRIVIPELIVEQKTAKTEQVTRYFNVTASDIVNGKIASVASDKGTFNLTNPKNETMSGVFGASRIKDFDFAYLARLYTEKAADTAELKPVYGAFSIEAFKIKTNDGADIAIAQVSGSDFKARLLKQSWTEAMKSIASMENFEKAAPAERSKAIGALSDFFEAFSIGKMELNTLTIANPKGKEPVAGKIALIAFTGATASGPAEMRVEGLDIGAKDGSARIAAIAFSGFSFSPTIEALKRYAAKPDEEIDPKDMRKFVPTLGTMRFSGIDFDVPGKKGKDIKAERIKLTVEKMELTADKPVNGIPSHVSMNIDHLAMPIPAQPKEDGLKELAAMGYKAIDLSWSLATDWNEAANELLVRDLSLSGLDMGSALLHASFGNVTKDAFDPDSAVAMVALIGATAKTVDLSVENKGLFEKALEQLAKKEKKTPEDLRRDYGVAAAVGIPAMLGNSPAAKTIGQAVAKFIAKPGKLNIGVKTKDPAGLGIADATSAAAPQDVLEKLDVSATAE